MAVQPIPVGFHTLTPYLIATEAAKLIEFLKAGFGAQVEYVTMHDGLVMHAQLKIGDSMLMLTDARPPQWPAKPTGMYLYVPNVDEVYQRAVAAGGESVNAPRDEFYGDRMAGVKDHCGNFWWIATHVEDVSEEEMDRRKAKMFGGKKA